MFADQGGWLIAVISVVGVVALGVALAYGIMRRKRTDPATQARAREATKALYHHEDAEAEAAIEGRPTIANTADRAG